MHRLWLALLIFAVLALVVMFALLSYTYTPMPTVSESATRPNDSPVLRLTSAAFENGGTIPAQYTCDGTRTLSPALSIDGVPVNTKSLVLIMDDPDIPAQVKRSDFQVFDHWVLFNIPPETREIVEGGAAGTPGANSAGGNVYTGPCPPPQYEPSEHRYVFTLYALDTQLPLEVGATKAAVLAAMQGHVIAQTQLIGRYKRP